MHVHGRMERRLLLAAGVTGLVCVGQVVGGLLTGSLALLADAAHVFLDAFALTLSYAAIRAARRPPTARHTYGYHRVQVLAALVNGGTLAAVALGIFREAVERIRAPSPVLAGPMLAVAGAGLLVNLVVAWMLHRHDRHDLNVHSAFLHVVGDALGSVGVIAAGLVILLTGWTIADPLVSITIGAIILAGAVRVLRRTVHILAEGVPEGMSAAAVQDRMAAVGGVSEVHDLHVWTVSPGYIALSAHVLIADQALSRAEEVRRELQRVLADEFGIHHSTIQLECTHCLGAPACPGPGCAGPSLDP
ncbi:MAG: Cobalt-zinc-cadmium resistance protein CzcD [Candidatus Bipolaricaulis sibiricus]|uniref:Cobalt-zinc-cadmium resistance protein CzcD n=1 Tax=Bipolaricaulis sibiricus TaxID=2501609 RepID=A0A410FW01_BIPS1|nr:MAG: Cobalt-zinc-cadmium resistance protein CzcD [Candidatus Bipolaricaulis sibiricus]